MGLKYLIRKYLIHVIAKKKGFTIYNYNVPLKILPYIGTGVLINRDVYFESANIQQLQETTQLESTD